MPIMEVRQNIVLTLSRKPRNSSELGHHADDRMTGHVREARFEVAIPHSWLRYRFATASPKLLSSLDVEESGEV